MRVVRDERRFLTRRAAELRKLTSTSGSTSKGVQRAHAANATAYRLSKLLRLPTGRALARFAPGVARAIVAIHHTQLAAPPVRITIPDPAAWPPQRRAPSRRTRSPASRLRRRYADAPAGAPRGAPSAPVGARRRFRPASKSGLLAGFIF